MQALCSADYQDTKRGDPSNAVVVQRGCRSRVGKLSSQVRPAAIEARNRLMIACFDMMDMKILLYLMVAWVKSNTNLIEYF